MTLTEKKVVIIGGSSGIGLAIAKSAAQQGAEVWIGSRSLEKLQQAQSLISGKTAIAVVDIADEKSLVHFFEQIGEFDHLTTPGNQGIMGKFISLETTQAKTAFESKFWGQYNAAKYAVPKIRPGGSITFFAGAFSQKPSSGASTLAAINSAIEGLGRALAVELSPIRVNTVSPGLVDSQDSRTERAPKQIAFFETVAKNLPAQRIGQPEDIAQTVLYLMTNAYTTGSTLYVDGGSTLR